MFYFYCPNCHKEESVKRLPRKVIPNCRDGFGVPIYHYECANCHNLDAGFMREIAGDDDEKAYYRHVIEQYQNIRGFSNGNKA